MNETLWITDAELIRRIGAPEKIAREAIRALDRDLRSGGVTATACGLTRCYVKRLSVTELARIGRRAPHGA